MIEQFLYRSALAVKMTVLILSTDVGLLTPPVHISRLSDKAYTLCVPKMSALGFLL